MKKPFNVALASDAELIAECVRYSPIFQNSEESVVVLLHEIKVRFSQARQNKQSFMGYTSFNKLCNEKLRFSHQRVRQLTPNVKLQNHSHAKDWHCSCFGADCKDRQAKIAEGLLKTLARIAGGVSYIWGGWAPWRPVYDSDIKKEYKPVEDRYRVTLFLSKKQLETLTWQN